MSVTITGLIGMILALVFSPEETDTILKFIDQAILVVGILLTYYGRIRVGDLKWWGGRK